MMTTREFQPDKVVSGPAAKAEKITVQPIPEACSGPRHNARREFQCQRPVPGARDVLTQLLLVWREDANATPPARNGHIPLLRVGRSLDGGIGEQDVINGLALRPVGRDGVAREELAEARVQHPAIHEFDTSICANQLRLHKLAVGDIIEAMIISVEPERNRIGLSIKALKGESKDDKAKGAGQGKQNRNDRNDRNRNAGNRGNRNGGQNNGNRNNNQNGGNRNGRNNNGNRKGRRDGDGLHFGNNDIRITYSKKS